MSLTLSAATATKILAVAHGEPVTVSALASNLDFGGLLAIALVSGAPLIASLFGLLGASSLMEALREEDSLWGPTAAFAVGALIAFALAPRDAFALILLWSLLAFLSSIAIRAVRGRRRAAGRPLGILLSSHPMKSSAWTILGIVGILASAIVVLSDSPWLPKEMISFVDGGSQIGYIVSDDGDFTYILDEFDRTVQTRRASEVSERKFCDVHQPWLPGDGGDRSLLADLLWQGPSPHLDCDGV